MFKEVWLIFIMTLLLLSGCAINSGVIPMGQDTFMITRQAATGFSGLGNLKVEAWEEANEFCIEQGKCLQVVNTRKSQPPYILGNFPRVEIQFKCLNAKDPEYQKSNSQKATK